MFGTDVQPGASSAPAPSAPAAAPAAVPASTVPAAPAAPERTATQAAVDDQDFSRFRDARRAERSGKPLEAPPRSESPAAPAVQPAASTGASPASPASEPGAPKPAGHGGNAETRIQELVRKNKELEAQLASAKAGTPANPQQTTAAASSAAPPAARVDEPQPNPDDATKYPQGQYDPRYIADLGAWGARQETRRMQADADARTRQEAETTAVRERLSSFTARIDAAKAADPAFISKLSPDVASLKPLSVMTTAERGDLAMQGNVGALAAAAVMDEVIGSDASAELLVHFSEHPEDLQRLTSLHPRQMLREFGRLEARFGKPVSAGSAPAAAAAPAPVISSAPAPPEQLGGRQTTPADPVRAAVASGDFQAFRDAKLAQRAAAAHR